MGSLDAFRQAEAEIRLAEARRMLGLEKADHLASRAAGWLGAGVVSPSVELLATGGPWSEAEALRILRSAAVELELTFATPQAARVHYIDNSLASLTSPQGAAEIFPLANGMTDELTAKARRALGRFFRRRP